MLGRLNAEIGILQQSQKIKPEENCYRYYEMVLYPKNQSYYVELKWGRLHGSIVPKWVKRKELKFTDSNEALKAAGAKTSYFSVCTIM